MGEGDLFPIILSLVFLAYLLMFTILMEFCKGAIFGTITTLLSIRTIGTILVTTLFTITLKLIWLRKI
ncbi:hypothetical protein AY599_20965 [Leptolyngbya valderiana BDU 20041]|nr:hypothetical protein AY599_20965 [Leptolyngbya valderiana BDU 20041]